MPRNDWHRPSSVSDGWIIDGLNLATGIAFGHGGVFVLNVPYLLFYPDRNRDDVPDGDPEVLLTGFGMEDAHSVANSLTWGPDGWLYGCQGSTVTANIRGIEFQQGVWRYHPVTKQFELFCEGGGNSWGLDFDAHGHLLYSTNYGGHVLLHGVQGAYSRQVVRQARRAAQPARVRLLRPRAARRTSAAATSPSAASSTRETRFPESFRGKYIAGDLLGHGVYWHTIEPRGSTLQTAHGGELLVANDTWFAPTDVTHGPGRRGLRRRLARPADGPSRSRRRLGPLERADLSDRAEGDAAGEGDRLCEADARTSLRMLHAHRSQWYVRRARQELARRVATAARLPRSKSMRVESLPESIRAA